MMADQNATPRVLRSAAGVSIGGALSYVTLYLLALTDLPTDENLAIALTAIYTFLLNRFVNMAADA